MVPIRNPVLVCWIVVYNAIIPSAAASTVWVPFWDGNRQDSWVATPFAVSSAVRAKPYIGEPLLLSQSAKLFKALLTVHNCQMAAHFFTLISCLLPCDIRSVNSEGGFTLGSGGGSLCRGGTLRLGLRLVSLRFYNLINVIFKIVKESDIRGIQALS